MTSHLAAGSPILAVPRVPRARASRARAPLPARAQTGRVGDDAPSAIPPNASVLVIGASGRTGREVVRECLSRGISVRAGTRDGAFDVAASLGEDVVAATVVPWTTPRVVPVLADVTRPETIARAIATAEDETIKTPSPPTLVVFAATAPARGDPDAVDRRGLAAVANACVAANVPRLVVVSGAGVTPKNRDSPAYRFLNAFGGRMDAKASGETRVVDAFRESREAFEAFEARKREKDQTKNANTQHTQYPSYTIVRPSGLTDAPRRGVACLATNRGDVAAGFVSRADVAACVVACGFDARCAFASFEVYDRGTAVPAATLSVAEILSDPNAERVAAVLTGQAARESAWFGAFFEEEKRKRDAAAKDAARFERAGFASWGEMFAGIERDAFLV